MTNLGMKSTIGPGKAKNRFEQVDEIQPDAINLQLSRDQDGATGVVVFPASASDGKLPQDTISDRMPARDSFRAAIKLANEARVAIVVIDPEGAWDPEWGELFRAVE